MIRKYEGGKPVIMNIPDFWDRLRGKRSLFLALDYDGTLAPFHVERMQAKPLAGIPGVLARIQKRDDTSVAIISGRPLAELVSLVGNIGVTMVGSHGFEILSPDGDVVIKETSPEQEEGFAQARAWGIDAGFGSRLETKVSGIALHTRGLSPDEASALEDEVYDAWGSMAAGYCLEVRKFNGGVELRAKGWNKGDALESLLNHLGQDTLCVYIGDDETDEDAFERILPYGMGIRVGEETRQSHAQGFVPDIESVRMLLTAWADMGSTQE